jgi:hypothetical protein
MHTFGNNENRTTCNSNPIVQPCEPRLALAILQDSGCMGIAGPLKFSTLPTRSIWELEGVDDLMRVPRRSRQIQNRARLLYQMLVEQAAKTYP